jgi:hypothetical protein
MALLLPEALPTKQGFRDPTTPLISDSHLRFVLPGGNNSAVTNQLLKIRI